MVDYKQLYINMLKQYDYNICEKCKNEITCLGKKCDCYIEGDTIKDKNSKTYKSKWTCEDLDIGECAKMINTPCNGCFDNNFKGFELKEEN